MNDRLRTSAGPSAAGTAVCPIHGLRFDASLTAGCIRCRATSAPPPPNPTSRRALLLGAGALAATAVAGATYAYGPWKRGRVGGEVSEIEYAPGHRGALFVPGSISLSTPSPVVLLLDPSGHARGIVQRYAAAAARHGWIAVSSFEIADGTEDAADTDALMALLDYVRAQHAVDEARVFAGGFSGGACGAYRLAIVRPDVVRGAIVECGHMGNWREVGSLASSSLRFYLFTRAGDFNRPATGKLFEAMQEKGCAVTKVEKEGGHEPMTEAEVSDAMGWMLA